MLLEGHLQHAVAERVAVETLDGDQRLLVVRHRHEAEALALLRRKVTYHLDVLHGAEGAEELPEHVLLGLGRQVVDEEAPARAAHRVARDEVRVWHDAAVERREPAASETITNMAAAVASKSCHYTVSRRASDSECAQIQCHICSALAQKPQECFWSATLATNYLQLFITHMYGKCSLILMSKISENNIKASNTR